MFTNSPSSDFFFFFGFVLFVCLIFLLLLLFFFLNIFCKTCLTMLSTPIYFILFFILFYSTDKEIKMKTIQKHEVCWADIFGAIWWQPNVSRKVINRYGWGALKLLSTLDASWLGLATSLYSGADLTVLENGCLTSPSPENEKKKWLCRDHPTHFMQGTK